MVIVDWRPVLGIDPSLGGFAVSLAKPNATPYLRRIKTNPARSVRERNARYRLIVDEVVEFARQTNPLVIIEGYSFGSAEGREQVGHMDRAELRGVLYDRLLPHCEDIHEVAPASLKKFGASNGRASKDEMKLALEQRYGRVFRNHDEADAWACMQVGLCIVRACDPETREQAEVVRGVLGLPPLPKVSKKQRAAMQQQRLIA